MADSLLDIQPGQAGTSAPQGAGPSPSLASIGPLQANNSAPGPDLAPIAVQKTGPAQAPRVRGDDLMAKANAFGDLSPSDTAAAKLFYNSKDILAAKMEQDPNYAEGLLGEMGKLKGRALTDRVIDAADQLKIDYLKKTEPELFNGVGAAIGGFTNTFTFGQMARLTGSIESAVIGGKPASDYIKEEAEKMRLLEKAYPKSNLVGKASAFLVPGSPARSLFESSANMGSHVVGGLLEKITTNPSLLKKVGVAAAAGFSGGAADGFVTGTLGSGADGEQQISFDRGAENSLGSGAAGAISAGVVPVLGAGLSAARKTAGPAIKAAANMVGGAIDNFVEQVSGTSAKALRAFNQNPEAVKAAAQDGYALDEGRHMVQYLQDAKQSQLPEAIAADRLLHQLPNVSAAPVLSFLEEQKAKINPSNKAAVAKFEEWTNHILSKIPDVPGAGSGGIASGKDIHQVPATVMREIVDSLQEASKDQFGKESNFLITGLKSASGIARDQIVKQAEATGGDVGQTYVGLMKQTAEKVGFLKFVRTQLGNGTPDQMTNNSISFLKNMFGANKEFLQAKMAKFDQTFGTNFLETAQNLKYASQLGNGGVPQALPTQKTGAALIGKGLGGAVGGAAGAVAGALIGHGVASAATGVAGAGAGAAAFGKIGEAAGQIISSPKFGAALIGSSDKITGFVNAMVANPEVLDQITKSKGFGYTVRKAAQEISNSLSKDGPISAGSSTRIIADTPFFIGLVHAFDITKQNMDSNKRYEAVQKVENARR